MKRIVCEICGGSDFAKRDGAYVCAGCGVRYAPSEAMKLLVDVGPDGVAASGVPRHARRRIDRVREQLDLAAVAFGMGNLFEAEAYAHKALALEPDDFQARRMLAQTVGAQAAADNSRLEEAIRLYADALVVAPDEFREVLQQEAGQKVAVVLRAHASKLAETYERTADAQAAQELSDLPHSIAERIALLSEATGAAEIDDSLATFVATAMNNAAVRVWRLHILPAYATNEHPDKAAMDAFLRDGDAAMTIIMSSIALSPTYDEGRYVSLVNIGRQLADAHSMRRAGWRWVVDYTLPDEEKARRLGYISAWEKRARRVDARHAGSDSVAGATMDGEEDARARRRKAAWKLLVALLCLVQFVWKLLHAPTTSEVVEAIVWLTLGMSFLALWYEARS